MKWLWNSNDNFPIKPAPKYDMLLVSRKGSKIAHWVMTRRQLDALIKAGDRVPMEIYGGNEYHSFAAPFTWSTLIQQLPYRMTPIGFYRMQVSSAPAEDQCYFEFHRDCQRIIEEFDLPKEKFWFDYMAETEKPYARLFQAELDIFRQAKPQPKKSPAEKAEAGAHAGF